MSSKWIEKEVRNYGFTEAEAAKVIAQAKAATDVLSRKEIKSLIQEYANDPSLIHGIN